MSVFYINNENILTFSHTCIESILTAIKLKWSKWNSIRNRWTNFSRIVAVSILSLLPLCLMSSTAGVVWRQGYVNARVCTCEIRLIERRKKLFGECVCVGTIARGKHIVRNTISCRLSLDDDVTNKMWIFCWRCGNEFNQNNYHLIKSRLCLCSHLIRLCPTQDWNHQKKEEPNRKLTLTFALNSITSHTKLSFSYFWNRFRAS